MNKSEFINEFRLTKRANGEYVIEKRYYDERKVFRMFGRN